MVNISEYQVQYNFWNFAKFYFYHFGYYILNVFFIIPLVLMEGVGMTKNMLLFP